MKKIIVIAMCIISLCVTGCTKAELYSETIETGSLEIQPFYNIPDKIIVRTFTGNIQMPEIYK